MVKALWNATYAPSVRTITLALRCISNTQTSCSKWVCPLSVCLSSGLLVRALFLVFGKAGHPSFSPQFCSMVCVPNAFFPSRRRYDDLIPSFAGNAGQQLKTASSATEIVTDVIVITRETFKRTLWLHDGQGVPSSFLFHLFRSNQLRLLPS